jgi:Mg-chelatase subunit ChlD
LLLAGVKPVTLLHPIWLFLLIPLVMSLWRWPLSSRLLLGLRCLTVTLLLLALCGLALRLPSRAGVVVVVADRSLSMPPDSAVIQKGAIDLLQQAMGADDQLGVVSFGQKAEIEHRPGISGKFPGFVHEVGPDGSSLAAAVERALELIPPDSPAKVLVLSDGLWTGSDPAAVTARSAARGVAIDYRPLQRSNANDLAVARVDAPPSVAPGEAFLITAWVHSPVPQSAQVELRRGEVVLAGGEQQLQGGLNRLTFRDRASEGGTLSYRLKVTGSGDDPMPENNIARVLVGVQGPRPVLHVTTAKASGLAKLLQAGKIDLRVKPPEECRWTLEELSKYSCVLLENVTADKIGTTGMETIAAWVRETGAGLMMTGGQRSYGPGGYYKSPLEPIMPVTMELRNEHRKLSVAIVVALDRSGSMALPVGGGRAKMDLADDGTAKVLELLSPMDEFGCIAVDTIPHEIVPLSPATDKESKTDKIRRIESMGGGIFIYEALVAAAKMIQPATASTRHIILFADAADSEEPGDYKTLVEKCRAAGITISVIGLGTERDSDAELLKDIAKRGDGRIFFTDKAEDLPLLFAQDTFVVARNTFLDEPVKVTATPALTALTGRPFDITKSIGGYNLTYLRPEATEGVFTEDEYKAPVVAAWQAGTGRVLCYTGEADGKYAGSITRWPDVGNYFTSLVRWAAGQSGNLPKNMLVTQEVRNGIGQVRLHLDPERKGDPFTTQPHVNLLTARDGMKPEAQKLTLRWVTADTLAAEVPLQGNETVLATVEVQGQKPVSLPPACLPYSPEFQPPEGDHGLPALQRLARATGGQERLEPSGIWKELPRHMRLIRVDRWLLAAAVLLLLLEVLERRTGFLSQQGHVVWEAAQIPAARARKLVGAKRKAVVRPAAAAPTPVVPVPLTAQDLETPELLPDAAPAPPPVRPPVAAQEAGMVEALRKARERTRGRAD